MGPERKIPRIIHQIWFQGWYKVPPKLKVNVDRVAELNPDYTHMKWDEGTLRAECLRVSPATAAKFDAFPLMIQKIDLGRYVVLYNYGGISVDTDMVQLKPIDKTPQIETADFIVSKSPFPGNLQFECNNALIMTSFNNPILLDLINTIIATDYSFTVDNATYVNNTTGPIVFNNVIALYNPDIVKLNNKYFEPCNSFNKLCRVDTSSIMDHQHEASWQPSWMHFLSYLLFIVWCIVLLVIPVAIIYGTYIALLKYFKFSVKKRAI